MEYFIVIGEENHDKFPSKVEELLIKLRGKGTCRLIVLAVGKSIETTVRRLREALLSNISVPVRLYLARSYDEAILLAEKILSEANPERTIAFLCLSEDSKDKDNVISVLSTRGVARVESC